MVHADTSFFFLKRALFIVETDQLQSLRKSNATRISQIQQFRGH